MSDLVDRLTAHLKARNLFPDPGLVLLAVSGGPDSVAMVDLFVRTGDGLGLEIAVAHVDHGIAAESGEVAGRVRALAEGYGLPFHLTTLRLGRDASETDARRARYGALRDMQRVAGARYLATAHQADDQVETVLFRILRGSGQAGLSGIPATGPYGLVRPLLPFKRAELKAWLDHRAATGAARIEVHTDPANFDPKHDRNWLRHKVLPVLRDRLGAAVDLNLLERGRQAADARRAWSGVLRSLPELAFQRGADRADVARVPLGSYDKALSETLLRAAAREAGCVVGPRRAARLLRFAISGQSGRMMELGGGWVAELAFDRVRIRRAATDSGVDAVAWGTETQGEARFGSWTLRWRPEVAATPARTGLVTWVTLGPGSVRNLSAGDRVRPIGGTGRRAVSRLLMEARVPRGERAAYPVVVRGEDVLWIPGVCRAAVAVPAPGESAVRLEASDGRPG
jgi:tRNA(Ile)-lysidine synthase